MNPPVVIPSSVINRLRKPDGGFTWQPITQLEARLGFAVSIYPTRSLTHRSAAKAIEGYGNYLNWNRDLLAQPDHFFGGWHDPATGSVHFDVSIVVDTREEAERLCSEHDQLAYYDFAAGQSVPARERVRIRVAV